MTEVGRISVRFEGDDRGLAAAARRALRSINSVNTAANRIGQRTQAPSGLVQIGTTARQARVQVLSLSDVAQRLGSNLDTGIARPLTRAQAALARFRNGLRGLRAPAAFSDLTSGISQLRGAGNPFGALTRGAGSALRAVGILTAAVTAVGIGIERLASRGSRLRAAEAAFRNTGLAVADLARELGGVVSNAALIQGANLANSFGISANSFSQFAQIARAASVTTGESVQFLLDSIVRGVARASPLILDNLGITVRLSEANEAYATQLGKTVDELTKAERQQALTNAVLASGSQIIDRVQASGANLAPTLAQLVTELQNVFNEFSKLTSLAIAAFFRELGVQFTGLSSGLRDLGPLAQAFGAEVARTVQRVREFITTVDTLGGILDGGVFSAIESVITAVIRLSGLLTSLITLGQRVSRVFSGEFREALFLPNASDGIGNAVSRIQAAAEATRELRAEAEGVGAALREAAIDGAGFAQGISASGTQDAELLLRTLRDASSLIGSDNVQAVNDLQSELQNLADNGLPGATEALQLFQQQFAQGIDVADIRAQFGQTITALSNALNGQSVDPPPLDPDEIRRRAREAAARFRSGLQEELAAVRFPLEVTLEQTRGVDTNLSSLVDQSSVEAATAALIAQANATDTAQAAIERLAARAEGRDNNLFRSLTLDALRLSTEAQAIDRQIAAVVARAEELQDARLEVGAAQAGAADSAAQAALDDADRQREAREVLANAQLTQAFEGTLASLVQQAQDLETEANQLTAQGLFEEANALAATAGQELAQQTNTVFAALERAAERAGVGVPGALEDAVDEVGDALATLRPTFLEQARVEGRQFRNTLIQATQGIVDTLTDAIGQLGSGNLGGAARSLISSTVSVLTSALGPAGPAVAAVVNGLVSLGFSTEAVQNTIASFEAVLERVAQPLGALAPVIESILGFLLETVSVLSQTLASFLENQAVIALINGALQFLFGTINVLLSPFVALVGILEQVATQLGLTGEAGQVLGTIIQVAVLALNSLVVGFLFALQGIIDVVQFFAGIVNGVVTAVSDPLLGLGIIAATVANFFIDLGTALLEFVNFIAEIIATVTGGFVDFTDGLEGAIQGLQDSRIDVPVGVLGDTDGFFQGLNGTVSDVIASLNGLTDASGESGEAIKEEADLRRSLLNAPEGFARQLTQAQLDALAPAVPAADLAGGELEAQTGTAVFIDQVNVQAAPGDRNFLIEFVDQLEDDGSLGNIKLRNFGIDRGGQN